MVDALRAMFVVYAAIGLACIRDSVRRPKMILNANLQKPRRRPCNIAMQSIDANTLEGMRKINILTRPLAYM
jgi:hypothetical protein